MPPFAPQWSPTICDIETAMRFPHLEAMYAYAATQDSGSSPQATESPVQSKRPPLDEKYCSTKTLLAHHATENIRDPVLREAT